MGFFFSPSPLPPRGRNTQVVRDGYKIQIKAIATFLIIFGACTHILFIIKVNYYCVHQMAI